MKNTPAGNWQKWTQRLNIPTFCEPVTWWQIVCWQNDMSMGYIIFLEMLWARKNVTTHFPPFQKMLWLTLESPKSLLTKSEFPLSHARMMEIKGIYEKFCLLHGSLCVPVYLEKHEDKVPQNPKMEDFMTLFDEAITFDKSIANVQD